MPLFSSVAVCILVGDLNRSGGILEILTTGATPVFDVAVHGAVSRLGVHLGQIVFAVVNILFDRDVQIQSLAVTASLRPGCNAEEGILGDLNGAIIDLTLCTVGAGTGVVGGVVCQEQAVVCLVEIERRDDHALSGVSRMESVSVVVGRG